MIRPARPVRLVLFAVPALVLLVSALAGGRPATQPDAGGAVLSADATDRTLAWRLYAPPRAPEQAKGGLVVWLHPAGATLDEAVVREYRQPLAKAGLALLVPTTSDPKAWSSADALKVEATIDTAIARMNARGGGRIDRKAVVLLGYSAGGQVAFALAARAPGRFAGVATMSAYPMGRSPQGRPQIWVPPAEHKDRLRFFLIVGEQEVGRQVLRQLEALYRARGFWVTLLEVPGAGHRFAAGQAAVLAPWMADAAAGREPADPLAKARGRDVAARQKTADRIVKELATIARRRPSGRPSEPATQTHQAAPWRLGLGPGWAPAGANEPGKPAVWRLARGPGEQAEPAAQLVVSTITAGGGLDPYLKAHLQAGSLRGGYAAVHQRGKLPIGQRVAPTLLLSERPVRRRPGTTELEESTVLTWEAFLPTDDPKRYVGVAVQWDVGRLAIDTAARVLSDVQRGLEYIGGDPATQPDEPGDGPHVPEILPPDEIY